MIYKSKRIGRNGKEFFLYKIQTLKEGTDKTNSFAGGEQYTRFGRILRKTKVDELPQIWNWIKGEIALVGPRPEEVKTVRAIPLDLRKKLFSVRPGLTSLSSIHFFDEGQILENADDPHKVYWKQIKPSKIMLDCFYIDHRDIFLDAWIIYKTFILVLKSLFK